MPQKPLSRRELLLSATAGAVLPSPSQDRWEETKRFLEEERAKGIYPGAALIASKNRRVAMQTYLGTCHTLQGDATPVTKDTYHLFYSYSKLVSSTVIAMLVEEGALAWDRPIQAVIPEFRGGGKDGVTLRHLLTHSAGIPSVPLGGVHTEAEWKTATQALCAAKTEWEPGSRCAYHALTGLFVAAEAARRVSGGKPWAEIAKERLFDPIGAKTLTFGLPPETAPVALTPIPKPTPKTLAEGYRGVAGHPAGGCFGTIGDALKVLHLHLNWGKWGSKRLLSEATLQEVHRVQYATQMEQAKANKTPVLHDTWGLGPLLRGKWEKGGGHDWFGFGEQSSPTIFGHAGIDTVIGVADPATQEALFFVSVDSPKDRTVALRNGVTNRVFDALKRK